MTSERKLVVLIDGTGVSAAAGRRENHSNIFRLASLIQSDIEADNQHKRSQILFYSPGPGTRTKPFRSVEMALGSEMESIIKEAYIFICLHYTGISSDEIHIFGYSRGAAAAKVLVSLIGSVGLLKKQNISRIDKVWSAVVDKNEESRLFLARCTYPVPIKFVGLFDPVFGPANQFMNMVDDETMNESVQLGLELLSIDEHRLAFRPAHWPAAATDVESDQEILVERLKLEPTRLHQIWLPGGHGDVGHRNAAAAGVPEISLLTMIDYMLQYTQLRLNEESIKRLVEEFLSLRRVDINPVRSSWFYKRRRIIDRRMGTKIHSIAYCFKQKFIFVNGKKKLYELKNLEHPLDDYDIYFPVMLEKFGFTNDILVEKIDDCLSDTH